MGDRKADWLITLVVSHTMLKTLPNDCYWINRRSIKKDG
jgi:hypothetical protein